MNQRRNADMRKEKSSTNTQNKTIKAAEMISFREEFSIH